MTGIDNSVEIEDARGHDLDHSHPMGAQCERCNRIFICEEAVEAACPLRGDEVANV